jgi:hypothetical protein
MSLLLGLSLFALGGWAGVAVHYTFLRVSRPLAPLALGVVAIPVLLLPRLVPSAFPFLQFVCACEAALLVAKLHDLQQPQTRLPNLRELVIWFLNPTSLVLRRLHAEPSPSATVNARRVVRKLVQAAVGLALVVLVFRANLERWSVPLAYVAKLLGGYVFLIGALGVLAGGWRFFGKARIALDNDVFGACTPAEFWRRYNRTVGQYFQENVFKRAGGVRAPIRATLTVFILSSVLHEYVFGIVTGKVQGYQTAFFMLQGLAVCATLKLRPRRGVGRYAALSCTWAFNLATSLLFFASFQPIVPAWARTSFLRW